jgi:hypothetical protein
MFLNPRVSRVNFIPNNSVETKTIEYLKLSFNFIYEPREDLCCELIANYLGVDKIRPSTSTKI